MAIMSNAHHPALDVPEEERVDYLIAVACMAAADNRTSPEEIAQLREMCQAFDVSEAGTERVVEAARSPHDVATNEILARLGDSEMRYALLVDAIAVARADGRFDHAESDELMLLADRLSIPRGQAVLVYRYVDTWRRRGKGPSDAKTTAKLVGAGIPMAALVVTAAIGAPLAAGVGLAAALGVSSYVSVKWLFSPRRVEKRRAKRRTRQPLHPTDDE